MMYDFHWGSFLNEFEGNMLLLPNLDGMKGRRSRTICRLVNIYPAPALESGWALFVRNMPVVPMALVDKVSIEEVEKLLREHNLPGPLPLRDSIVNDVNVTKVYRAENELGSTKRDAELPEYLQDLADEITTDIVEACAAFDNPDLWYPGVDKGIDPVPDDHVRLVIRAMQRELDRELRPITSAGKMNMKGPAAPLIELPWHIQRALVERRRLRYAQWGIGRQEWEKNEWSLWNVPEDPEWEPRRAFSWL